MINPIALKKLRILLSQNLNTLESNGIGKMIAIQALDTPDLLFRSPSVERLTRSCGSRLKRFWILLNRRPYVQVPSS